MDLLYVWILGIIGIIIAYRWTERTMLKRHVLSQDFLSEEEFTSQWSAYLKHKEESGCYAIFFYDKPINPLSTEQRKRFKTLYIGQSKDIFYRVHEHFTGRGNDGAMRLITHGVPAYAVFLPAGLWHLNDYETRLIRAFKANKIGLNVQRGGGQKR